MLRHATTALLALAALTLTAPAQAAPAWARPVVVGYVPTHVLETTAARTDLARFTHLNIAFANPDPQGALFRPDGALTCMDETEAGAASVAALRRLATAGQRAGAKVSLSVGGGSIPGCSGDWATLLQPATRDAVVAALIDLVDRAGLDGLDIDIEGELLTRIDQAGNYTPFIAALSVELKRRGKLLTCATASYEGGMIPVSSIPYFDLVNVMAYDAIGPWWGAAGDEHSPMSQAEADMALWLERGVDKQRLVLGVPFYGYGFGALQGSYGYRDIVARFADRMEGDVVGQRCAGCDYITFNSVDTITRKTRLGIGQGAGVMIWEISEDADDSALLDAIYEGLDVAGGR